MEACEIMCSRCGRAVRPEERVNTCPACDGRLDISYSFPSLAEKVTRQALSIRRPGVWKYRELLPVGPESLPITLGEGGTGLHRARHLGGLLGLDQLYLKNESTNPTGSFKDRAATVAITKAQDFGAARVAIASTGSAGASAAAFAAAAGLECFVFVPKDTPNSRLLPPILYGATVFRVEGTNNDAIKLITRLQRQHGWYNVTTASLVNPFQAEGVKTIAYEIVEDLGWQVPDWVIVPVGGGGLLGASWKGFMEFRALGLIDRLPHMVGVQPLGCAPLVRAFEEGRQPNDILPWEQPSTIATTKDDVFPLDGDFALVAIRDSGGVAEKVSDEEMVRFTKLIAKTEGLFVEPTAAEPVAAVQRLVAKGIINPQDTVVAVLTGNGLRDTASVQFDFSTLPVVASVGDVALTSRRG